MILQAPQSRTVTVGSTIQFSCTAVGNVFWQINDAQVQTQQVVDLFASVGITVPLSTPSYSVVTINASLTTNGTTVQCLVGEIGNITVLNRSDTAELLVFGKLCTYPGLMSI